jgi:hypothetical protein
LLDGVAEDDVGGEFLSDGDESVLAGRQRVNI